MRVDQLLAVFDNSPDAILVRFQFGLERLMLLVLALWWQSAAGQLRSSGSG